MRLLLTGQHCPAAANGRTLTQRTFAHVSSTQQRPTSKLRLPAQLRPQLPAHSGKHRAPSRPKVTSPDKLIVPDAGPVTAARCLWPEDSNVGCCGTAHASLLQELQADAKHLRGCAGIPPIDQAQLLPKLAVAALGRIPACIQRQTLFSIHACRQQLQRGTAVSAPLQSRGILLLAGTAVAGFRRPNW